MPLLLLLLILWAHRQCGALFIGTSVRGLRLAPQQVALAHERLAKDVVGLKAVEVIGLQTTAVVGRAAQQIRAGTSARRTSVQACASRKARVESGPAGSKSCRAT